VAKLAFDALLMEVKRETAAPEGTDYVLKNALGSQELDDLSPERQSDEIAVQLKASRTPRCGKHSRNSSR